MTLEDYRKSFQAMQTAYMDIPTHVHIETVAMCNANCVFCPQSTMDRRGQRMSDKLFEKILNDLKEIPVNVTIMISPFKVNEPLLDAKIFSRINRLTTELPNAKIYFTTNLNLANPSILDKISQIPRLVYVWVSLNSLRELEYRQLMGLSLQPTLQNIHRLLQLNREKQFTPNIYLSRVADETINDQRFLEDVQSEFADFKNQVDYRLIVMQRGQWMGFTKAIHPPINHWPCQRWFEISITCTGEVAFCCMDGYCKHSLGNVNQQSILEIYNQPDNRKRRLHQSARGDVRQCFDCTFV